MIWHLSLKLRREQNFHVLAALSYELGICYPFLQIDFLLASDGKPWVWVMGEHKDDLPYDQIVQHRELKKQEEEKRAEIEEAENLAKKGIISIISKPGKRVGTETTDTFLTLTCIKAISYVIPFSDEMEGISFRERPRRGGQSATERC